MRSGAVIQPVAGQRPDADDVIAFCAERLAGFTRPRRVVCLDELPRNAAGKILKRDLRGLLTRDA